MNRKVLLAGVMGLTLVELAAAGQRRLTLSEAEQLALAALGGETEHPPRFSLAWPAIPPKNGAMFEVVWADPASASVPVHALLIDIDTGEVWEPGRCERVTTSALEKAQSRIRRELKISPVEVDRARAHAKANGCSNLIDEVPNPADFHRAQLVRIATNEKKTLYRYTITVGDDVSYVALSATPLRVREGEIQFCRMRTSMYVIDADGRIQELNDGSGPTR